MIKIYNYCCKCSCGCGCECEKGICQCCNKPCEDCECDKGEKDKQDKK